MKQKIIMISTSIAAIIFMGRNQIMSFKDKYISHKDSSIIKSATIETPYIDTILEKSKKSVISVGEKSIKSDSMIITKVEKTAKNIEVLHTEVKVLKKENNELKAKLGDTVVNVNKHFNLLPVNEPDNGKSGSTDEQ